MRKFTPGPWRVVVATDSFGWRNYAINDGTTKGDARATANLIAAAPDLYRLLAEVIEDPCKREDITELEREIRQVLARIDGESEAK